MMHMFVGPMPVSQFLADFVPPPPGKTRPDVVIDFDESVPSNEYEDEFVRAIDGIGPQICPTLGFANTKNKSDRSHQNKRKPDISAFPVTRQDDEIARRDGGDWKTIELSLEVKPVSDDPFIDPSPHVKDRKKHEFQHLSSKATEARGQLISYAQAQFCSQFRRFSFSICLMGTFARLIRWDRSGSVVTERFEWKHNLDTLVEFLWRFSHLSPEGRGRDTTVVEASAEETALAREILARETYHYPKGVPTTLYKFRVHDDEADVDRYFVAPLSTAYSPMIVGRATFGYVALDLEEQVCVYLKDSWRIEAPDMVKEGAIYRRLHQNSVRNIPDFGCAGDVLQDDGSAQMTVTQTYRDEAWASKTIELIRHVHYRLVLRTIGIALETFSRTKQLCAAVRDAIIAHSDAVTNAHVLHRDVSAGNVIMTKSGEGLLIDWDLSKIIEPGIPETIRQQWRTGTWQFISAQRLQNPWTYHEVADDLESFLHVLIYILLCYRPSQFRSFQDHIHNLFESYTRTNGFVTGGDGKMSFFQSTFFRDREWRLTYAAPCADIIRHVRSLFKVIYSDPDDDDAPPPEKVAAAHAALRTADAVLAIFNAQLRPEQTGWPEDDGSVRVYIPPPTMTSKRRHDPVDTIGYASKRQRVTTSGNFLSNPVVISNSMRPVPVTASARMPPTEEEEEAEDAGEEHEDEEEKADVKNRTMAKRKAVTKGNTE